MRIKAGDMAKGQALRTSTTAAVSQSTFNTTCRDRLNVITPANASNYRLLGSCVFSASADITTFINDPGWPTWAKWVEFRLDQSTSPTSDLGDHLAAATAAATAAHAAGKQIVWAPSWDLLVAEQNTVVGNTTQLKQIASVVNMVLIQYGTQYATGLYATDIPNYANIIHSVPQRTLVAAELRIPTETNAQIISAFQAVNPPNLGWDAIGTQTDGTNLNLVIAGLRP